MKSLLSFLLLSLLLLFAFPFLLMKRLHAAEVRTSGHTLLNPPGARALSLSEAFSAASDDVSALKYNPASLTSLQQAQASFLYHRGSFDDKRAQLIIGQGNFHKGFGFLIDYYNAGEAASSAGTAAQRDWAAGLSFAAARKRSSIGVTGKYFSSELFGYRAHSFAGDIGLHYHPSSRIQFGAAVQNIGTALQYDQTKERLPTTARVGAAVLLSPRPYQTMLFIEAPYRIHDKVLENAVGVEILSGPLSLRGGIRQGRALERFTLGAGILVGKINLDYAFVMVDKVSAPHTVSLTMRFGGVRPAEISRNSMTNGINQDVLKERIEESESVRFPKLGRANFD